MSTAVPARPRRSSGARRGQRPRGALAGTAQWSVWTTTARLVVTDAAVLPAARALVEERLAAVDAAASRFRPDSEVVRAARTAGAGAPVRISGLLADLVGVALDAAERTGGAVDPTLGRHLEDLGYADDLDAVRARPAALPTGDAPVPFRAVRATAGTDPLRHPAPVGGLARRRRPARPRPRGRRAPVVAGGGAARPGGDRQGPRRGPVRPRRGGALRRRRAGGPRR